MRYYVKKSEGGEIGGSYSVEEMNRLIRDKKIGTDWVAISDIGQSTKELGRSPDWHWMWIADIPGVTGIAAPSTERQLENRSIRCLLVAGFVLLILIVLFAMIAFSISAQLRDLH